MAYLVWILTAIAIALGFALGVILGKNHDYRKLAIGTMLVGYTGEEDDAAHLFLNLDEDVSGIESREFVVLRVKKVKARK